MRKSRRGFVFWFFATGVPLAVLARTLTAQLPVQSPSRKPASKDDDPNAPKPDTKAILEANEKDIKKSVERLYQLASELKAEVEKTDSVQVLSLGMLKKTEEIEKLAKGIRSRAKG
jgi:cell division septation protein DedD